jgi:hypothetical protein
MTGIPLIQKGISVEQGTKAQALWRRVHAAPCRIELRPVENPGPNPSSCGGSVGLVDTALKACESLDVLYRAGLF